MHQPQPVIPLPDPEGRISSLRRVPDAKKESEKRTPIEDQRFKAVYEDPAFAIDESRRIDNTGKRQRRIGHLSACMVCHFLCRFPSGALGVCPIEDAG